MIIPKEKKSGGCFGWLALLAILVGGGAFLYFKLLTAKPLTPIEAAKIVPDEAVMASFINTDSQSWSKLDKFQTPPTEKLLNDLKPELSQGNKIDYQQDIQPWLGNVMLAFVPTPQQAKGSSEPDMLIILGIKNKIKALEFANKVKDQSQQKIQESEYQGVKLWETVTAKGEPLTYALLDAQLLVASRRSTIEAAIDTQKGQPSLAQKADSKAILSQNLKLNNPVAQLYITDYPGLIKETMTSSGENVSPETLKQLNQMKSVVMGLGIEDQGLHLRAYAKLDPTVTTPKLETNQNKLLSQFPAETLMVINGQGLSQWWSQLVTQAQDLPSLELFVNQSRQVIKGYTTLDLDKDVFGWMDGEFALGIITSKSGMLGDVGIGGILMFETRDRATATNTMNTLDNQIKTQIPPFIQPKQTEIQGIAVTEWNSMQGQTAFSHGWVNNNLLALSFGSPLTKIIETKPNSSLIQSPNFQNLTASLPKQNSGYFYLNFDQGMSIIKKLPEVQRQPLPPETEQTLNSILGIAVTATMPDATTSQLDLILALRPK